MTEQTIKPVVQQITLATTEGPIRVRASVYGPLAVHNDGGYWTITHVGTGLAIDQFWSQYDARQIARRLLTLAIDWDALEGKRAIINLEPEAKQHIIDTIGEAGIRNRQRIARMRDQSKSTSATNTDAL